MILVGDSSHNILKSCIHCKNNQKATQRKQDNKNHKQHIKESEIHIAKINECCNDEGYKKIPQKSGPAKNKCVFQKLFKSQPKRDHH